MTDGGSILKTPCAQELCVTGAQIQCNSEVAKAGHDKSTLSSIIYLSSFGFHLKKREGARCIQGVRGKWLHKLHWLLTDESKANHGFCYSALNSAGIGGGRTMVELSGALSPSKRACLNFPNGFYGQHRVVWKHCNLLFNKPYSSQEHNSFCVLTSNLFWLILLCKGFWTPRMFLKYSL